MGSAQSHSHVRTCQNSEHFLSGSSAFSFLDRDFTGEIDCSRSIAANVFIVGTVAIS